MRPSVYPPSNVSVYGLAGLPRLLINLKKDRTQGEFFPQITGQFFYCEATDLPCRLSFNNSDESQSLGISSGFQMNMPFSGFTLFHDDYSTAGTQSTKLSLIVYTSREPRAFNQYVAPQTQLPLPYTTTGLVGPLVTTRFPIFPRVRFVNVDSWYNINNVSDPLAMESNLFFRDINGNNISSPSGIVKSGISYPSASTGISTWENSKAIIAGSWGYTTSKRNIPVPQNADFAVLFANFAISPTSMLAERHFFIAQ